MIKLINSFTVIVFVYMWSSGKAMGYGSLDKCSSPCSDNIFN